MMKKPAFNFTAITVGKDQRPSTAWPLRQWAYWLCVLAVAVFMLLGFVSGPNHFSLRVVTIDSVTFTTSQSAQGAWKTWIIDYSRQSLSDGQTEIGRLQLGEAAVPRSISQAEGNTLPGTDVLLRVPVAANEPTAKFAFNRQVRQGALLLSLLLLIRWHVRRHADPLDRPALMQLILIIAAINWLLIFDAPQGTD